MKSPKNLRIETHPYPHLRDDDGCVLANDYWNEEKLYFILDAVRVAGGTIKDGQFEELRAAIRDRSKHAYPVNAHTHQM